MIHQMILENSEKLLKIDAIDTKIFPKKLSQISLKNNKSTS